VNLRAKVRGGRLQLDEPVDLPEGSEVDLISVDDDDLDDEDRARLHAALDRAEAQVANGRAIPAEEVFRRLGISPRR